MQLELAEALKSKSDGEMKCEVCIFLLDTLLDAQLKSPLQHAREVRVQAKFDQGLGSSGTAWDLLELQFEDTHVEVEICVDREGEFPISIREEFSTWQRFLFA